MLKTFAFVIILFLFVNPVFSQTFSSPYTEQNLRTGLNKTAPLYQNLTSGAVPVQTMYGIDIAGSAQNGAVTPYAVYNDPFHYLLSPFISYQFNDRISFDVRVNVENIKDELVRPERTYWSDEFAGHRGGFEIAKIEYNTENIFVKFGRDYFLPGIYLYENLLFSRYNYPYDQIVLGFKNDWFELSSYYLALNTLRDGPVLNQRHLNGHRLSVDLKIGYIAFNDVILYGGDNRQMNVMLFNPFLLYYPYQKNNKNFESNSLMSLELFLEYNEYFFFVEFLMDDYQVDKEVPGDLEPTEWGMNVTLGKKKIAGNFDIRVNYTRVANRTFNAPEKDYEKYIYKNYPIGHFLGNNFWELKSSLTYKPSERWWMEVTASHLEYGDEALYAPFNKDYLNYTVDEGYSEAFPFGSVHRQSGMDILGFYNLTPGLLLKGQLGYWFQNDLLKEDVAFGVGLAYRFAN